MLPYIFSVNTERVVATMSDDSNKETTPPAADTAPAPPVPETPPMTTWKLPDGIEDHLAKGK
jgi:hypothetical protein